ncbi:hypothetical protein [Sorangium sp. So ce426]
MGLVLQGRKETVLGADSFPMGVGECLLSKFGASPKHDLPAGLLARSATL